MLMVTGLALFARAPADAVYASDLLPVMVLLGIGAGLSFPALMTLAMSGATRSDSGLASGLANTTQQVGGALGLAVLATLSTTRSDTLLDSGRVSVVRSHERLSPGVPDCHDAGGPGDRAWHRWCCRPAC